MSNEVPVDRQGRAAQCLGNDLAAIQPSPRILRTNADKDVSSVWLEIKQSTNIHDPRA